jgi:hypothetical protein
MDAGLDSITAVEIKSSIERTVGVSLPVTVVFDYPSVHAIALFVHSELNTLNNIVSSTVEGIEDVSSTVAGLEEGGGRYGVPRGVPGGGMDIFEENSLAPRYHWIAASFGRQGSQVCLLDAY